MSTYNWLLVAAKKAAPGVAFLMPKRTYVKNTWSKIEYVADF